MSHKQARFLRVVDKTCFPQTAKSIGNMETKLHKYQFGRKRETSHEKGKAPAVALGTRRKGKVEVKFIEDKKKRQQTRNTRRDGIFKKAREFATMTGDRTRLEIGDIYFDAEEEGLTQTATRRALPTQEPLENEIERPSCSSSLLSPRAIRSRAPTNTDAEVQCNLLENVDNHLGNCKHCRVCASKFDSESRQKQNLWIGCDVKSCDYWLHASCLLGESRKINPKFCSNIPYTCPVHR